MASPLRSSGPETQPLLQQPPDAPSRVGSMDGVHLESHLDPDAPPKATKQDDSPQISWAKTLFAGKVVLLGLGAAAVIVAAPITVPFAIGFAAGWMSSSVGDAWSSKTHRFDTGLMERDLKALFTLPLEPFKWPKAELDCYNAIRATAKAAAARADAEMRARERAGAFQSDAVNESAIYEPQSQPAAGSAGRDAPAPADSTTTPPSRRRAETDDYDPGQWHSNPLQQ